MATEQVSSAEAVLVGESKITSRGQITLPQELRQKYHLKAGDRLYFLDVDGSIVLKLGPLILTE
jgi:AbrB family looped-hinge helix DNA binding protein